MEILLWLVPSLVVLAVAMVWATWRGREGRGEIDRDVAAERLGKALAKEHVAGRGHPRERVRDRSTGIAVRPTQGEARDPRTRRAS